MKPSAPSKHPAIVPADPVLPKSDAPTRFRDVAERDGVLRTGQASVGRVRPPEKVTSRIAGDPESVGTPLLFQVTAEGEHVVGLRDGTDSSLLPWLQRQEPDGTLDLHGMQAEVARRALHRFVRARRRKSHRVLLVITGRGLRSATGPVLRDGAIEWLTEHAVAEVVCAFESAPARLGGSGAIVVLLEGR